MTPRGASMAPPPPPSNAATGKASAPTKPAGISRWPASWWRRAAAASRRSGFRCATRETPRARAIVWSAMAPGRSSRRVQRLEPANLPRTTNRRPLLGLELCRFDDIAEAFVVVAHARAELLRTFFQGLQTALGQAALDVRIVLHRMNMPRQRSDHAPRRPFRGDDSKPRGEFIFGQTGLGRRWEPRNHLEPL